jgi:hypothetical protein
MPTLSRTIHITRSKCGLLVSTAPLYQKSQGRHDSFDRQEPNVLSYKSD